LTFRQKNKLSTDVSNIQEMDSNEKQRPRRIGEEGCTADEPALLVNDKGSPVSGVVHRKVMVTVYRLISLDRLELNTKNGRLGVGKGFSFRHDRQTQRAGLLGATG